MYIWCACFPRFCAATGKVATSMLWMHCLLLCSFHAQPAGMLCMPKF